MCVSDLEICENNLREPGEEAKERERILVKGIGKARSTYISRLLGGERD